MRAPLAQHRVAQAVRAGPSPRPARRSRARAARRTRAASGTRTRPRAGPPTAARRPAASVTAIDGWIEAVTPSAAKRGMSSGCRHCACSIRGRIGIAHRRKRVERVAVRDGRRSRARPPARPRPSRRATISSNCVAARDLHAAAVEQASGARAERAVHVRLDVVGAVVEPRRGQRLPDAERQLAGAGLAYTSREPISPSLQWIAVTPRAAATGSAARVASTSSACVGSVKRSRNDHAASSRRTPASRSTSPPGRSRSPPACASAAEFSHSLCQSCASSAVGTSPVTASSAASDGSQPSAVQPKPRSQRPGRDVGDRAGDRARGSRRASRARCSSRRMVAHVGKCTWLSVKPGSRQPPREVDRSRAGGSSSSAAIRSPSTTSDRASGRAGSIVRTVPPRKTVVIARRARP